MEGSARKQQRYVLKATERDGATFEVCQPAAVPPLLPELGAVSNTWLREKRTREKAFSLGDFDPDYLAQCPVAVVRWKGEIVAFANLWCSGERTEVSPDLMRYLRAAPPSAMEYLFLKILLWAKDEGYAWLNLGMAPLAGLEARAAAPLWNRVGALAFRYGEQFYNFQGLRQLQEQVRSRVAAEVPRLHRRPRAAARARQRRDASSRAACAASWRSEVEPSPPFVSTRRRRYARARAS